VCQLRTLAIRRSLRVGDRDSSARFIVLDSVPSTSARKTLQNGVGVESAHVVPIPLLFSPVFSTGHAVFIEPVGYRAAIARLSQHPQSALNLLRNTLVLGPVMVRPCPRRLNISGWFQGCGAAVLLEAVHELVLQSPRCVGVVTDVFLARGEHILFPCVLGRIDAIVWRDHANSVIHRNSAQAHSFGSAN
jgi:hypothetical protein